MSGTPLLSVRDLKKHYPITEGVLRNEVGRVRAVDGISFDVHRGETLGIVGESGCGKSTAASTLLRLEEPTEGSVIFDGDDVTEFGGRELKQFRRRAQMIFQDPSASFDPRMSMGDSVAEPLIIHGISDRSRRRTIVENLLERVGLSADDHDRYPHEFSGGQKQRIALARALVLNPDLLIADEPTSALDVSIQAEILQLIEDIQDEFDLSIVFISHDLGVIREICDRVAVMYLGEIVELAPTDVLFEDPQHPYTRALLTSIPRPDPHARGEAIELTGDVPSPSSPPPGCRFHTRCPEVIQPPDYDLEQAQWRRILDFRVQLRGEGITLEAVEEFVRTESMGDGADVTDEMLKDAIRQEFGIPDPVSSPSAEDVLSQALDLVVEDDQDGARELLAEEFPSVCEETCPELQETDAGHPAACHLHADGRLESEPRSPAADD